MSAMSDYLEQKLLDHLMNGVAYSTPQKWIALYTAAPGEAGGGTEVSGGSYARQRVYDYGGGSPAWAQATSEGGGGYVVDNGDDIDFPTATAAWGVVSDVAIKDASTGGNFLLYGSLSSPKTIGLGDTFSFPAGSLDAVFR
jgi:hypothetical protein